MINCHLSIILVADSRKKNRTSIVVLTKKKNFRELQALEWAENAHFGSEKEKRRKTSEAFFRVIFPRVKICKFSFSCYKDQRKSGRLRHFTNVGLFFLSIPIPGFVPSDRFAWNGPVRLSFTDRRNSSLCSSDTTGRAFGKPNRTLVPAPMVFRHKTLHLPSALQGKEGKFY